MHSTPIKASFVSTVFPVLVYTELKSSTSTFDRGGTIAFSCLFVGSTKGNIGLKWDVTLLTWVWHGASSDSGSWRSLHNGLSLIIIMCVIPALLFYLSVSLSCNENVIAFILSFCGSFPDPVLSKNGVSFSSVRSKNIKKKPLSANNRIHPGSTDNNSNSNGGPVANGKRAMRGDLSLYHDAKYKRNNYLRARHRTRENKAQVRG